MYFGHRMYFGLVVQSVRKRETNRSLQIFKDFAVEFFSKASLDIFIRLMK